MASGPNVFVDPGFVSDGFYEPLVPVVVEPVVLNLGAPGDAVFALPFRALGGSVLDLDLLYGLVGQAAAAEDIQPIFAIATREGMIRAWGKEMPREAIREACVDTFATLDRLDDIVIEGSPLGPNLFGSVGLTTLATFGVTLDNSDGALSELVLREIVMYAPAGVFADIAHTVVAPVVTGAISSIVFDGAKVHISGGMSARVTGQRSLTPHMNLDQVMSLRTAGEYSNPGSATDILPEVFGDWLSPDLGAMDSTAVGTPAVLIDQYNLVYCVNARQTAHTPPVVMWNGVIQDPSTYIWNPVNNYEDKGLIATLTFHLNVVTTGTVSVRHGGATDALDQPIRNPFMMLFVMLTERAHWTVDSFDVGTCQQTRRDMDVIGYPAYWVWNEEQSIRDWLLALMPHYHCDFVETGNAQLAIIHDRTLTNFPIAPDYHVFSHEIDDHGSPATAISLEMHGDDVVNQVTIHARYNWAEGDTTIDYPWDYPQSQSAYQAAYPAEFTFRGMYTLGHATQWLHSFAIRHGFDPTLVSFTLYGLKGLPLIPPRLITVEWPLWGWQERLLKIIRTAIGWEDHRVSLSCVDCQRELDEQPDAPQAAPDAVRRDPTRVYQWLPGAIGDRGSLADAPRGGRNEAANGDFQRGDDGSWQPPGRWEFVQDVDLAYEGRWFIRHLPNTGSADIQSLRVRISPDEWVLVSGMFAADPGTNGSAQAFVGFFDVDDTFFLPVLGNPVQPHASYLESVVMARAPAGAYYYRPVIRFQNIPTVGSWRCGRVFAVSGSQQQVLNSRAGLQRNLMIINGDFEQGNVMFVWDEGMGWDISNDPDLTSRSGIWQAVHYAIGVPERSRFTSLSLIPVSIGPIVNQRIFVKGVGNPDGQVRCGFTYETADGGIILPEVFTDFLSGPLDDWTSLGLSLARPANAANARAWIEIEGHADQGTWLFDDWDGSVTG